MGNAKTAVKPFTDSIRPPELQFPHSHGSTDLASLPPP